MHHPKLFLVCESREETQHILKELEYVLFFSSGIEMKSYFSSAFSGLEVLGVGNRVE